MPYITSAERYEGDNHPLDPPDYIRFYFLNITNVAEVRNGEKPILVCTNLFRLCIADFQLYYTIALTHIFTTTI